MRCLPCLASAAILFAACGNETFVTSDGGGDDSGGDGGGNGGGDGSGDGPAEACTSPTFSALEQSLANDRGCSLDTNCGVVFVQTDCCTFRALGVNHAFVGDGGLDPVLNTTRACLSCKVACLLSTYLDQAGNVVLCTMSTPASCFVPRCESVGGGKNECFARTN